MSTLQLILESSLAPRHVTAPLFSHRRAAFLTHLPGGRLQARPADMKFRIAGRFAMLHPSAAALKVAIINLTRRATNS
jgi:hypothetical protein